MARNKKLQSNIDLSDPANFPDGRIKDNDGSGNGTSVNEVVYGDIHETFAKLMRLAGKSFNALPDSEQFGYQYVDALAQLASKNDYIQSLYSLDVNTLGINLNLSLLKTGESFVCLSTITVAAETTIRQGLTNGGVITLNVTFKGSGIKSGDYVRFVKTSTGVDLIRLSDGVTTSLIINELGYMLAASQIEEDAGVINTKATTPLTNFTAFATRVIGAQSVNFLATQIANGLMSKTDKLKLDNLESDEKNYGTFGPFDVDTGSVNDLYLRTGDVTEAKIVQRTSQGQVIQVTLANAMDNTTYETRLSIESLGVFESDNDIKPLVFKKIDTTKFQVFVEETSGTTQSIKIHVAVIQR